MNIIQGDTTVIGVELHNADGSKHTYNSGDIVKFGLAEDRNSQTKIISKNMTYDSSTEEYCVELTAAETGQLIGDERYWFDIGVQTSDGKYYRAVPCSEIWVIPGVTEVG